MQGYTMICEVSYLHTDWNHGRSECTHTQRLQQVDVLWVYLQTEVMVQEVSALTHRDCTMLLEMSVFTQRDCTMLRETSVFTHRDCTMLREMRVFTHRHCTMLREMSVFTHRHCTMLREKSVFTHRHCSGGKWSVRMHKQQHRHMMWVHLHRLK